MKKSIDVFAITVSLLITSCMVLFQTALALGAPFGHYAWGGQYETLPTVFRIGSVLSIVVYAYIFLCIIRIWKSSSLLSDKIARRSLKIFGYYLILGVVMNAISRSHVEALVMTPTAFLLCISLLYISYKVNIQN